MNVFKVISEMKNCPRQHVKALPRLLPGPVRSLASRGVVLRGRLGQARRQDEGTEGAVKIH